LQGIERYMSICIHRGNADGIKAVSELLISGKVVALPTETVYGLAANALDEESVRRIFEIKMRPLIDPLIVHFYDLNQLEKIAFIPPEAITLAEHFWPGALTIVLNKRPIVPDLVTASRETVAVRMPAKPEMREVLNRCGLYLAAPSANPFGYVSPTSAQHVVDSLGDRLDAVLDGGPCEFGLESTIINLSHPESPSILRKGPIAAESLEEVLGREVAQESSVLDSEMRKSGLIAPGTLSKHYSPRTQIQLQPNGFNALRDKLDCEAIVLFQRPTEIPHQNKQFYWLSETGNLAEAGKNLFKLLRNLDKKGLQKVSIEMAPAGGLGDTINDRLIRAAAKS